MLCEIIWLNSDRISLFKSFYEKDHISRFNGLNEINGDQDYGVTCSFLGQLYVAKRYEWNFYR